jgi:hypothetical protein
MLQIFNTTPFTSSLALLCEPTGADVLSVAVKGTFSLPVQGGEPRVADEQQPVLHVAQHYGDPDSSSIKYPADIVLGKVGTDIGLVGSAHAPGGKAVSRLPVSLSVGGFRKVIYVIGDRQWKGRVVPGGLAMSEPKPFVQMPLVYERAFGGKCEDDKKRTVVDFRNPVGMGFWLDRTSAEGRSVPNLEDPAHPIESWKDRPPVAGYGFVDGWWEPRRRFAGTYDEEWRKKQFPLLPRDFSLRFCNAGQEGLVAEGFLRGGEAVELVHVSPRTHVRFALPKLRIGMTFRLGNSEHQVETSLWTLVFEPDANRFFMVWGATFPVGRQPSRMKHVRISMDDSELVRAAPFGTATGATRQPRASG